MVFKVENELLFSKIETGAWFCFSNLLDSNPKPKVMEEENPKTSYRSKLSKHGTASVSQ